MALFSLVKSFVISVWDELHVVRILRHQAALARAMEP